jgi:hypothetical protein
MNGEDTKTEATPRKRTPNRKSRPLTKKYYLGRLNWVLDFLNTDISGLPRAKFTKVLYEALDFLYGDQVKDKTEIENVSVDSDLNRKALTQIHDELESNLWTIQEQSRIPRANNTPLVSAAGTVTYKLQVVGNRISLVPHGTAIRYDRRADLSLSGPYVRLDAGKAVDKVYLDDKFKGKNVDHHAFFTHFYDEDLERTVLLSLVPLLQTIPVQTIKQCKDCEKYYLATKKKKDQRCRKCLQRAHTYAWRKKHRPKYNASQSESRRRRLNRKAAESVLW